MGRGHQSHVRFPCPSGAPQQGGKQRPPGGWVPGDGCPALLTLLLSLPSGLSSTPHLAKLCPHTPCPTSLSPQPPSTHHHPCQISLLMQLHSSTFSASSCSNRDTCGMGLCVQRDGGTYCLRLTEFSSQERAHRRGYPQGTLSDHQARREVTRWGCAGGCMGPIPAPCTLKPNACEKASLQHESGW